MSLTPPAVPRNLWEASELVLGGGWLEKTGAMASLKPLDATGEFQFSRNSTKLIFGAGNALYTVPVNRIPLRWVPGRNRFELFPERSGTNQYFPSNSLTGATPEGITISGNTVSETTANSIHRIGRSLAGINLNQLNCFSVDISQITGTSRLLRLEVSNGIDGEIRSRLFNPTTLQWFGTTSLSGSWSSVNFRDGFLLNPDGSITLFLVGLSTAGSSPIIRLSLAEITGTIIYVGSTGVSVRIEHFQIQGGTLPSSRILTTTGSASRSADQIRLTGASARIGQTQGVVRCEVNLRAFARQTNPGVIWQFDDGTLNNRICLQAAAGGNTNINLIVVVGGVTQVSIDANSANDRFVAIVVKYRAGEFKVWVNGVLAAESTFNGMPTGLANVSLGGIAPLLSGHELNDFIGDFRNTKLLFTDEYCLAQSQVS